MKKFAIIVAGGSGQRMQRDIPKQFLLLKDKPVLMHTLLKFREAGSGISIILVLPEAYGDLWKELEEKHGFDMNYSMVTGGETRFDSVKNGLKAIQGNGLVAVHDAVRPLISAAFINRLYADAEKNGNAVPVVPVKETLRMVEGENNTTADRSLFRIVQTPQVFDAVKLQKAFDQPWNPAFTDEATVMQLSGEKIFLSDGDIFNIKITTPEDLVFAGSLV
jgi:2-C-methyl-D-erythritol 4-phosphate cytidylyltransferase